MTSNPLISLLVRSMDRPTLDRALASIAAQDYPNIEVIVVAASGAAHRELPDRCGSFPLRLIRPERPLTRAEAANAALDAAQGEWLNFLDDDDELLPAHVGTLQRALAANPDYRLVHSCSEDRTVEGRFVRLHGGRFRPWRQLDTGFFHPHCAMFARSLIDEGARFDPSFDILEDMDFFVQCAQKTRFAFVPQPTARYYVDAGDSGVGLGANRDEARLAAALDHLRGKWSELEAKLRELPGFRVEQALWLIDQGLYDEASVVVAGLLTERPGWVDTRVLESLLYVARGRPDLAESVLAEIGDAKPTMEPVAARLEALRGAAATRH